MLTQIPEPGLALLERRPDFLLQQLTRCSMAGTAAMGRCHLPSHHLSPSLELAEADQDFIPLASWSSFWLAGTRLACS